MSSSLPLFLTFISVRLHFKLVTNRIRQTKAASGNKRNLRLISKSVQERKFAEISIWEKYVCFSFSWNDLFSLNLFNVVASFQVQKNYRCSNLCFILQLLNMCAVEYLKTNKFVGNSIYLSIRMFTVRENNRSREKLSRNLFNNNIYFLCFDFDQRWFLQKKMFLKRQI